MDTAVWPYLTLFGRLTLALAFGFSGITKLANMAAFAKAVGDFRILPSRVVGPFAMGVMLAEIGAAACLLIGSALQVALPLVLALLTIFSAVIAHSLINKRPVVCRCFGELATAPAGWGAVARNGCLAAIAVAVLYGSIPNAGHTVPASDAFATGLLSLSIVTLTAAVSQVREALQLLAARD